MMLTLRLREVSLPAEGRGDEGFMGLGLDGPGFGEHGGVSLVNAIGLKVFCGDGACCQDTV